MTTTNSNAGRSEPSAFGTSGYILTNLVSHSRCSSSNTTHAFKYNTLAVFVELSALERGELDVPLLLFGVRFSLGLKLFGYNSQRAICALRPDLYLFPSEGKLEGGKNGQKMKIREKLQVLLWREGLLTPNDTEWRAWMLTMPSYLGFEGINPLTVYFVYTSSATELAAVVFEVHNTFGEAHVYFMKPGVGEDSLPSASKYTHQWTFPRAFHVSPFNDRTGFYTVALSAPSMPTSLNEGPKVVISIRLREVEPVESQNGHRSELSLPLSDSHSSPTRIQPGKTKLTATLSVLSSRPFVSPSSVSSKSQMNPLLLVLLAYPFTLFLSFPRILYQAGILHYRKVLDVYLRPEPLLCPLGTVNTPGETNWNWISTGAASNINPVRSLAGLTVRRQPTSWIAQYAKERLKEYLDWRVTPHVSGFADLEGVGGIDGVVLVMPDAYEGKEHQQEWFVARRLEKAGSRRMRRNILRITPLSPKFFELLLLAPSAGHALLAGGVVEASLESDQSRTHSVRHSNSHSQSMTAYAKILNTHRGPNDVLFVVNDAEMFARVFIPPSTAFSPAAAHPSSAAPSTVSKLFSLATNLSPASPASHTPNTMSTKTLTLTQRLRCFMLPNSLTYPLPTTSPKLSSPLFETEPEALNNLLHIPDIHFLDSPHHYRTHRDHISTSSHSIPNAGSSSYSSTILSLALLPITTLLGSLVPLLTLMILISLDLLEPRVFALVRARIVPGTETWGVGVWGRVRERVERVRGDMR